MRVAADVVQLQVHRRTADQHRRAESQAAADAVQRLIHLDRELAGREHDKPHALRDGEPLEHRDAEREGLSRAGLRHADDVLPLDRDRDGLLLDRRRHGEVKLVEGVEKLRRDA